MMLKDFVRNGNRFWRTFAECSHWAVGRDSPNGPPEPCCVPRNIRSRKSSPLGWRNSGVKALRRVRIVGPRKGGATTESVGNRNTRREGRYRPWRLTTQNRTECGAPAFHESAAAANRAPRRLVGRDGDLAPGRPDLSAAGVRCTSAEPIADRRAVCTGRRWLSRCCAVDGESAARFGRV
jgi:hypothetical protein